ncbi:GumC family protein [Mameliella sediminis]|uniref:GumC family protein n=1 Tax=Mameliella sediminis TaxID=2836866 RepID=UPI001C48A1A2|nr:polysaccharide biosynthesis tyrosine autokinase [Mameliella sediminis]MBV7395630.1 polysaccharide biosynthesis tyrosine autokinase [Mameliella sediminis]
MTSQVAATRSQGHEAPAQLMQSDSINVGAILDTVWRAKLWVIGCMFGAAIIAGYYAYFVADREYRANAVIEFTPQESSILNLDSIVSGVSTDPASVNTEIQKIQSREMIEKLVNRLDLTEDPNFNKALDPNPPFSLRNFVKKMLGLTPPPVELTEEEREENQFNATVGQVGRTISVQVVRDTYLLSITAQTYSRRAAADLANTLADLYIETQLEQKFSQAEQAINWLSDRARELEDELFERENAIRDLQSASDLVSRDALAGLNVQVKEFRERLQSSQEDIQRLTQRRAELLALRNSTDKAAILSVYSDPALTRLGQSLSDDLSGSEGARQAFRTRMDTVVQSLDPMIARARAEITSISRSLEQLEGRVSRQTADLLKLEQMEREVGVTRDMYQTFLSGMQEATVQVGLVRADTQLHSRALPPRNPAAPRRSMIVAVSAIFGGLFGAALVLLRNMKKQRVVLSSADLAELSARPVLGEIPKAPRSVNRTGFLQYLQEKPTSQIAESVRNLRTSVLMAQVDNPSQVIVVSSSLPGEGKTTISLAIAHNLAGLGRRVLLIEGDIRRRTFSHYYDEGSRVAGIVDVMVGEQSFENAVHHDPNLQIDVLFGQKSSVNPSDLFASQRFHDLIEELRGVYDHIVIDSPPVLIVPDARILATVGDALIYVTKWDMTEKLQVAEGLRQFQMVGIDVTGFVLNQIDYRRSRRYGYSAGYSYSLNYGARGQGYYDT